MVSSPPSHLAPVRCCPACEVVTPAWACPKLCRCVAAGPAGAAQRLGALQPAGYVSLLDAQHVRIMTKLHSMLESLSEWRGPERTSAELLPSDLRPGCLSEDS